MSRFRRTAHSVASNYVSLVATGVYSLASVPLALHYLSGERFGLWTLMASITAYLSLIDLGMSAATSRLLIDHKDDPVNQTYGSLMKTGWLVSTLQGMAVLITGYFAAPLLAHFLNHTDWQDASLRMEFIQLVRWQCVVVAFAFTTRIFSQLLYAHQRMDLANYAQVGTLLLNFILQWFFFHNGHGVFSLIWAGLASSILGVTVVVIVCRKLMLFPPAAARGRFSWVCFKEAFAYGTDMFLVAVGAQLIMASQALIITNALGLEAAGAWNVGVKMFNLLSQVIWSVPRMSAPAFSEMIVRQEQTRLRERYQMLFVLTLSLSAFAAVSLALCNSLFVPILSHHKFGWPPGNDLLLGIWMIILAVVHCHNSFVLLTKKIRRMSYVYFAEGIAFVISALLLAPWGGLPAVIGTSIVCSTLFSGAYGVWRISDYFQLPVREVAFRWLIPMGKVLLIFAPLALVVWFVSQKVANLPMRLLVNAAFCGTIGFYLFLRFGISPGFQMELLGRVPKPVGLILRRIFVTSPP